MQIELPRIDYSLYYDYYTDYLGFRARSKYSLTVSWFTFSKLLLKFCEEDFLFNKSDIFIKMDENIKNDKTDKII